MNESKCGISMTTKLNRIRQEMKKLGYQAYIVRESRFQLVWLRLNFPEYWAVLLSSLIPQLAKMSIKASTWPTTTSVVRGSAASLARLAWLSLPRPRPLCGPTVATSFRPRCNWTRTSGLCNELASRPWSPTGCVPNSPSQTCRHRHSRTTLRSWSVAMPNSHRLTTGALSLAH